MSAAVAWNSCELCGLQKQLLGQSAYRRYYHTAVHCLPVDWQDLVNMAIIRQPMDFNDGGPGVSLSCV